ncbi:MAG: HPr family phosphocarrier protein [Phycisphaerae bacterium]
MEHKREIRIQNKEGLHFRPIMQLVDLMQKYKSEIRVQCEDRTADGRSPMELLMLVATQGSQIEVVASGEDARSAVDAVATLIESGFGEN